MSSTEIEKENLEAHVELCAVRYHNLETKLDSLERRMDRVEECLIEIRDTISAVPNESNKTLIAIGTTIFGAIIGGIITLIVHIK